MLVYKIGMIPIIKKGKKMEKYSKQREEIMQLVKQSYHHPTAEEIYQELKKQQSTASRGTVYRNLNYLVEKGEIIKISNMAGSDRYDYIRQPHSHAICTKCGIVYDFEYPFQEDELAKFLKHSYQFNLSFCGILVNGICQNCNK